MFDFEEALRRIAEQTVLCVGDVMLDDFVYGDVTRISPEAPTPVLAVGRSEVEIGGAGNVARNIAALGARCIFVGLIGNDEAGRVLTDKLGKLGVDQFRAGGRQGAANHAQGALRLRASLHPPDARRLGNRRAGERGKRSRDHRLCRSGAAAKPAPWCCPTTPRACSPRASSAPSSRRRGASANRSWSIPKATITASIAARR